MISYNYLCAHAYNFAAILNFSLNRKLCKKAKAIFLPKEKVYLN